MTGCAETDEQLMMAARHGSRPAFDDLFERHRDGVWRFFRRRVPDPARAAELTQDVFVGLLQALPRYQPLAPFRSYLFGIAYRVLLAERRSAAASAAEPLPADLPARPSDLDAAIWVRRALDSLEPDAREVLMLREYEQLTYQEIALTLQIPLNTVRSRLFRAREDARAALSQVGKPAAGAPA